jgi:hypothetical protein
MSDLIERLRGAYSTVFERSMAREAANEIEHLTKQRDKLLEALHQISLCSQNSMSSKEECGRIARTAIAEVGERNEQRAIHGDYQRNLAGPACKQGASADVWPWNSYRWPVCDLEGVEMSDHIATLNDYANGDEYQRAVEWAVSEIERLTKENEELQKARADDVAASNKWRELAADEIERLQRENEEFRTGYKGSCYACEPVAIENQRLRKENEELRAELKREQDTHEAWQNQALQDEAELRAKLESAEPVGVFDVYGDSYIQIKPEYANETSVRLYTAPPSTSAAVEAFKRKCVEACLALIHEGNSEQYCMGAMWCSERIRAIPIDEV